MALTNLRFTTFLLLAFCLLPVSYARLTSDIVFEHQDRMALSDLSFVDVDNDGDLDLAVAKFREILIFENRDARITNTLLFHKRIGDGELGGFPAIAFADVDSDGDLDLAVARTSHMDNLVIYENDGNRITDTVIFDPLERSAISSLAFADVDNDGDLDLAVGQFSIDRPDFIYENDGSGITERKIFTAPAAYGTDTLAFADVDNDGDLDLAVGTSGEFADGVLLYENDGNGITDTVLSRIPGREVTALAFADVDNDGDLDLAVGNGDETRTPNRIYENENGVIATTVLFEDSRSEQTHALAFADTDNDGDLDLAVGNDLEPNLLYENIGGRYGTEPLWTDGQDYRTFAVSAADVDGDGDLELAFGHSAFGYAPGLWNEQMVQIFDNNEAQRGYSNSPPAQPTMVNGGWITPDTFAIAWCPARDRETPSSALFYNLRVTAGADSLLSGAFATTAGTQDDLRGANREQPFRLLRNLPKGARLSIAVQALDNQLDAGAWSSSKELRVPRYRESVALESLFDPTCRKNLCGNGFREPWEECDDGNHIGGDGCHPNCKKEFCADGHIQRGQNEPAHCGV